MDYTFAKAFSVADTTGSTTGYVTAIYYNGEPVAIELMPMATSQACSRNADLAIITGVGIIKTAY